MGQCDLGYLLLRIARRSIRVRCWRCGCSSTCSGVPLWLRRRTCHRCANVRGLWQSAGHDHGLGILSLFQIGCALANNLATLIVLRFLGGVCGAVAFNSIGTVSDLYDSDNQGWGVNTFAISAEAGATIGPIIGAFIVQDAGWRWTFGVSGIVLAFLLLVFILTVPETRAGVILAKRAKGLRKDRGDTRYYASHEKARSQRTATELLQETLARPLYMLFTEPLCLVRRI